VNIFKTNVVVFKVSFEKARAEVAFYVNRGAIETVTPYRYLGVEISCGGS
jgi:hypothetical protein